MTGNELKDWKAIGQRVAFRDGTIVAADLMQGNIEDEIVAYALYLIRGGTPPSRKPLPALGSGATNTPVGKSKAPRSRRKSTYQTTSDRMFLVRDKKTGRSRSRIRADSIEIVEPEPESGSGSEAEFTFFAPPPQRAHSPHPYEIWSLGIEEELLMSLTVIEHDLTIQADVRRQGEHLSEITKQHLKMNRNPKPSDGGMSEPMLGGRWEENAEKPSPK